MPTEIQNSSFNNMTFATTDGFICVPNGLNNECVPISMVLSPTYPHIISLSALVDELPNNEEIVKNAKKIINSNLEKIGV